ncbi:MAG: amidohydrolase [Candidatus Bipolaricaulota bacterium]|nr:amidohydrolase [Candidatus Bipolaricaulota bacterium]MDW8031747.1 amidohydrolase [Candidatus Bipolaricaulota bacterium]
MIPVLWADLIIVNANIHTVSSGRAQALAVSDGKIVATGQNEEIRKLAGPKTKIEDLGGKTVLPGFIDAHMHLVSVGLRESGYYLDLSQARSLNEALELVRQRVQKTEKAQWVLGRGWDESRWPERRYITRADLDKIAPEHPVALIRICGHILCANSLALQKISVTPRAGEFDESLGLLREETAWAFLQKLQPSDEQIRAAIVAGAKLAHRLGVTAIHDISKPEHVRAYMSLLGPSPMAFSLLRGGAGGEVSMSEGLQLRVRLNIEVQHLEHLMALGLRTNFGNEFLKLGAIKLFADGSIGARNAALSKRYHDSDSFGKLNYEQSELNRLVKHAHDHSFQVMIHAIGDRAIDAALEALAYAGATPAHRHRIEHAELLSDSQIARMKGLGIIASMQPNFVQWSGPGGLYETRLGPERDAQIDPHRKVLDAGVKLAFGSDGMPFGPLYGIHCAVNAPHPNQRVSVEEAIRAYTLDAAYAAFEEHSLGSLEPGKLADFVVLSEDPAHAKNIKEIRVERTYLAGRCVFEYDN